MLWLTVCHASSWHHFAASHAQRFVVPSCFFSRVACPAPLLLHWKWRKWVRQTWLCTLPRFEMWFMTQSEANQKRAGKGREDPNDYPQLVTPAEGRGWGDVLGGFSISLPDLGLMKKIIPIVLFTLHLIICFSFTYVALHWHSFMALDRFGLHESVWRIENWMLQLIVSCVFPFHISLQLRLCLVLLRFIGLLWPQVSPFGHVESNATPLGGNAVKKAVEIMRSIHIATRKGDTRYPLALHLPAFDMLQTWTPPAQDGFAPPLLGWKEPCKCVNLPLPVTHWAWASRLLTLDQLTVLDQCPTYGYCGTVFEQTVFPACHCWCPADELSVAIGFRGLNVAWHPPLQSRGDRMFHSKGWRLDAFGISSHLMPKGEKIVA